MALSLISLTIQFIILAFITVLVFEPSLERIGKRYNMSEDMSGATLMAMGSSAPELFIALGALFMGGEAESIGAGTIIGSALFNVLFIIGASIMMVKRSHLDWQPIVRDNLHYFISIIWLAISFSDGQISLVEAAVFVSLYPFYLLSVWKWKIWFPYKPVKGKNVQLVDLLTEESQAVYPNKRKNSQTAIENFSDWIHFQAERFTSDNDFINFGVSILIIAVLSKFMIDSALVLAAGIGMPPAVVALTILAFGTSVPDLLASLTASRKGKSAMAVSNAVGSNVFDIDIGLGVPWLIMLVLNGGMIHVSNTNLAGSVALLIATIISTMLVYKSTKWAVPRIAGVMLATSYIVYLVFTIAGG